ncbi:MAG: PKD domain-containing protein, partial [Candidatus Zixiibacteriota bacterium]
MRIQYGCLNVGYKTSWIDYNLPKVVFWADSMAGWVPHDVNFEAFSMLSVDTWSWDFGNGHTASVQTPPTETYTERGSYDVTLEITSGIETHTVTRTAFITAIADTLKATSVSGEPGEMVEVVVSGYNAAPVRYIKIPVEFGGDLGLQYEYNGFSTAGCRTDYF